MAGEAKNFDTSGVRGTVGEVHELSLRSPTNQMSLAYWEEIRGDRAMPARADLQPQEMVPFLRCVILLDVLREPLDFRYRLIGTKVTQEMIHNDHTGRKMTEIPHQSPASRIFSNCRHVVETCRPIGGQTPYVGPNADYKLTEDGIMPRSEDGETVNMLFVTADFTYSGQGPAMPC